MVQHARWGTAHVDWQMTSRLGTASYSMLQGTASGLFVQAWAFLCVLTGSIFSWVHACSPKTCRMPSNAVSCYL